MFGIFKKFRRSNEAVEGLELVVAQKNAKIKSLEEDNNKKFDEILAHIMKSGGLENQLIASERACFQYQNTTKVYAEKIQELEKEVQYQKRENQLLVLFAENLKKENDILRMCSRSF
jgi:hypothetical protein